MTTMKVLAVWIFFATSAASMDVQQYETSLINVMNEDWIQSRATTGSGGSGCEPTTCGDNEESVCDNDCCTCECKSGFTKISETCTAVKEFGGGIVLEETYFEANASTIAYDAVYNIYKDTDFFINVTILSTEPGSIIADYLLLYEDDKTVTEKTVEDAFNVECNCSDSSKNSADNKVNCSRSCGLVINRSLVCQSGSEWYGYCDNETTTCEGTAAGNVTCTCRSECYTLNETTCYDKECANGDYCNNQGICFHGDNNTRMCRCDPGFQGETCEAKAPTCNGDSDCNSPFGSCNTTSKQCNCMWGFQGDYCYQPWMFVLTIVASGLGLIIIILIIVFVCYKRKEKKNGKHKRVEEPLDDLNPFSEYQPGMMRAQLPSYLTSSVTDPVAAPRPSASAQPTSSSTFNQPRRDSDGDLGGAYNNYGYATVDKTRRSSSKRSSPTAPPSRDYF